MLRLVVLGGAVAVSLATGYLVGRVKPTVDEAVRTAEQELTPKLRASAAGKPGEAEPKPAAPPIEVAGRPYPARAGTAVIAVQRLGREARAGEVTLDCLLTQTQLHPACRVADIRGTDAVSAAALGWLQGLSLRYVPGTPDGTGKQAPDHRWRVTFEDFSGTAKPASRRAERVVDGMAPQPAN